MLSLGKFWDIYDICSAISPIEHHLGVACLNLSATACRKTNLKYNILFITLSVLLLSYIEAQVEAWEDGKCCGNMSHRQ